jgi:hypothetical protein
VIILCALPDFVRQGALERFNFETLYASHAKAWLAAAQA